MPDRVGRVCGVCEAPRAFAYVRDWPVTTTTGAWGKYVEPVYRCLTCGTLHSGGYTTWGPVRREVAP